MEKANSGALIRILINLLNKQNILTTTKRHSYIILKGFPTNGPLVLGTKNFKFFLTCPIDTFSTLLFLLCRHHHLHQTFAEFIKILFWATDLEIVFSLLVLFIACFVSHHTATNNYNLHFHLQYV